MLISHPTTGLSQSLLFRQYTAEQGLPSSGVNHVIQDAHGFIWLATDKGVSRFNGRSFSNFSDENGLCENRIEHIGTGLPGKLLLRSRSGGWCFIDSNGSNTKPLPASWKLNRIGNPHTIHINSDSSLWLGMNGPVPLLRVAKERNAVVPFEVEDQNVIAVVSCAGKIVAGSNLQQGDQPLFLRWITNSDTLRILLLDHFPESNTWRCSKGSDGTIWITIGRQLIQVFPNGKMQSFDLHFEASEALLQDRDGNLWIGDANGGIWFFPKEVPPSAAGNHYLETVSIGSMFQDREGCFWFSSKQDGVYFLASKNFTSYSQNYGIESNIIQCLTVGNGRVYLATDDGLVYQTSNENGAPNTLSKIGSYGKVYDLATHPDGSIWISSLYGLYRQQERSELLAELPPGKILVRNNGKLVFGADQELLMLRDDNTIDSIKIPSKITALGEDQDGKILLGTENGLYTIKNRNLAFLGSREPKLRNYITSIHPYKDRMLVATMGAGIFCVHEDSIMGISTVDGLVSNLCNDLWVDEQSHIWVATNAGLNCLKPIRGKKNQFYFEVFSNNDGLISNEVNQVAVSGQMVWAGTNHGLSRFNLKVAAHNIVPPLVQINRVRINNNDVPLRQNYDLKYSENNIMIDYVGLCFREASDLEYMTKIVGENLDTTWFSSSSTLVQYNPLPNGRYTFTLSAKNKKGIWAANPITIHFEIRAPYWKTWWFISTVVLSLVSVLWSIFYIRLIMLKRQTLLLRKAFESEQKALRSQMTPHFIFNSLNSIQLLVASNNRIDALKNLSKFSKLMRKILQNSKRHSITLIEELETLELYLELENLRFQNRIKYILDIDPSIDLEVAEIPPMLIQPYVENAIWHGLMNKEESGGLLKIAIIEHGDMLICSITDNGVGRDKARKLKGKQPEHQSSGMTITKERLIILNATRKSNMNVKVTDLKDADGTAAGTQVEIFIPQ